MFLIYDILYIIFAICYLPIFLMRGKCHRGFLLRLGIVSPSVINQLKGQKVIWLHTVSVGEAQACSALVKNLKYAYPDFRLVISTVTKTGNKIAQKLITVQDLVIYSPLDIGFVVRRLIHLINPRLFIIAETEIWPNLIINLKKKRIPVVLVNGRLSSGSFQAYTIIRPFFKDILQGFQLFCMQTEQDAQRIIRLGADKAKVKITGNMKFDTNETEHRLQTSDFRSRKSDLDLSEEEKLFIAGSTHRGEEKIILQAYQELVKNYPGLRLLIAPRHIERTQEIENLISEFGFKSQRVSQLFFNAQRIPRLRSGQATHNARQILVLDTIGQLKSLYAYADIVFIGGSLIRHGGQNPIEPAVFSKAILFGPDMSNFSSIARLFLNKRAAIMVKDTRELKNACVRLLNEPEIRKQLGQNAKELIEENKGATLRNVDLIRQILRGVH